MKSPSLYLEKIFSTSCKNRKIQYSLGINKLATNWTDYCKKYVIFEIILYTMIKYFVYMNIIV